MKALTEVIDQQLTWEITSKKTHSLMANGQPVARIHWRHPGDSKATGDTAHGSWELKRKQLWKVYVTITRADTKDEIAQFKRKKGAHRVLTFSDGRAFHFGPVPGKKNWRQFATEHGDIIYSLNLNQPSIAFENKTAHWSAGLDGEALSIMLLLGWYIEVIAAWDEEAESVAVLLAAIG